MGLADRRRVKNKFCRASAPRDGLAPVFRCGTETDTRNAHAGIDLCVSFSRKRERERETRSRGANIHTRRAPTRCVSDLTLSLLSVHDDYSVKRSCNLSLFLSNKRETRLLSDRVALRACSSFSVSNTHSQTQRARGPIYLSFYLDREKRDSTGRQGFVI